MQMSFEKFEDTKPSFEHSFEELSNVYNILSQNPSKNLGGDSSLEYLGNHCPYKCIVEVFDSKMTSIYQSLRRPNLSTAETSQNHVT